MTRERVVRLTPIGLLAAAVLGTVIYALVSVVPNTGPDLQPIAESVLYATLFLLAAAVCLSRAAFGSGERRAWTLIGVGLALATAGYIYDGIVMFNDSSPPYPSPADALWLSLYPFVYAGVVLLARERIGDREPRYWLEGLLGALTIAAVGAAVFYPLVQELTLGSPAVVATNLLYSLGDLCLLGLLTGLWFAYRKRLGACWPVLIVAFAVNLAGDAIYALEVSNGTYVDGGALDLTWPVAVILIATAALMKPPPPSLENGSPRSASLAIPTAEWGVCALVLVYGGFESVEPVAVALAGAGLLAAGARSLLVARELNELRGFLSVCAECRSVHDEHGEWTPFERYVSERSGAEFSHGLCPACAEAMLREIESRPPRIPDSLRASSGS